MRDDLDNFLASIPDSGAILAKHAEAVALFGFFLGEIRGEPIPRRLSQNATEPRT
jgi:hypothetical protein